MKRRKINIIRLLFASLCMLIMLVSCKKKTKETLEPFASVSLNVISNGKITDTANVEYYVFDTEQGFNNAKVATTPSNYILSGKANSSKIEIPQLPSGTDHYILVRYFDTNTFPNFSILYTNEESTYLIPAQQDQAQMEGELLLKPQEGLFTFYSKDENAGLLPILLTVGNAQSAVVNSINSLSSNAPQTIKLRKGQYPVKGKSNLLPTCEWIKNVTMIPGQNTLVECEVCEYARVSFYSASGNNFPIVMTLGIKDTLGAISSAIPPPSCGDPNVMTTVLYPGKYSYYAYSESSKCAWTGTFELAKGDCKLIEIGICQR